MDPYEIWQWVQKIAGVLLVVCLCLYVLRCCVTADLVSLDQFARFLRGLITYLMR
jgi:hypothetical protein